MPVRRRLDVELVRRHLARSREHAQELISSGAVTVDGFAADKAARQVGDSASIVVVQNDMGDGQGHWVSRGAHKLLGALDAFGRRGLTVRDRVCLDAGASTGGFTQVLLSRGASLVHAVDVGYGQLAWVLRGDPKVNVMERVNIRDVRPDGLEPIPDVLVADLSFISLRLVLPVFASLVTASADLLVMVKPQFEVGRDNIGSGGVVRDPESRIRAVVDVAASAAEIGWPAVGVVASALPGPSGNVEYFLWLKRDTGNVPAELARVDRADIERAVQEGPQ